MSLQMDSSVPTGSSSSDYAAVLYTYLLASASHGLIRDIDSPREQSLNRSVFARLG